MLVPVITCSGEIEEDFVPEKIGSCLMRECPRHGLEIHIRQTLYMRNRSKVVYLQIYLSEYFQKDSLLTREQVLDKFLEDAHRRTWVFTYAQRKEEGAVSVGKHG